MPGNGHALLFVDGSVDPKTGIGFGACLVVSEESGQTDRKLAERIQTKRFTDTSSTKLELQSLLWAFGRIEVARLTVYTDSQNLIRLPSRRQRLEASDFASGKGKTLALAPFYKQFFAAYDSRDIEFQQLAGHSPTKEKNRLERTFALLDRAVRYAVRADRRLHSAE